MLVRTGTTVPTTNTLGDTVRRSDADERDATAARRRASRGFGSLRGTAAGQGERQQKGRGHRNQQGEGATGVLGIKH
jgi:hypothetical protein